MNCLLPVVGHSIFPVPPVNSPFWGRPLWNELMLQAGNLMPGTRGDALDALTVLLARKLAEMSRHPANIKSLHRRRPKIERDGKDRVDE